MNQILTDEEIFKLQYELQYREGGFHPIPFARTIEKAILNKLSEQKPSVLDADSLAEFIRTVDGNNSMGAGELAENITNWLSAARSE